MKITILVSIYYFEHPHKDDLLLKKTLEERGHLVDIINWDHPTYLFNNSDVVLVRSCWDYDQRLDAFLGRLKDISLMTTLINPFQTLRENSNKNYLKALENKGISIVDTFFINNKKEIKELKQYFKNGSVIIKPAVSASGKNTYKVITSSDDFNNKIEALLALGTVIVQPYYESIETQGERSTVVIDGTPVFTMLKKPAKGNFLVHQHKGGTYTKDLLREQDRGFIQSIIEILPPKTAYVRIDYLYKDDVPRLLELEMIEPYLYLEETPKGLKLLCNYIEKIGPMNKSL